ncbi:ABC transporter permease [Puniceicoccaceae bacterium]|nr:ABC transporter permease [Puniceicoccaceae bacterium]
MHPFRSFLAGLGVVFGVGAVVGMLAIGEGARLESIRQIQEMGVDKIIVRSLKGGQQKSDEARSDAVGIKTQDILHIANHFDNIKAVLPITEWEGPATSQWTVKSSLEILGVPIEFLEITNAQLVGASSRFLTQQDIEDAVPVCVVGSRLSRELFQYRDPVGERLLLSDTYYTVVGVLHHASDREIKNVGAINDMVYVPRETGKHYWGPPITRGSVMEYKLMYVVVEDVDQIENTSRRLESYLRRAHDDVDYSIVLPFELMKQQEATQRIFTIVMASIASISLLVGGIGIMNIMLANIYERMREIGTRRALGATRKDILIQFLVESVTLTAIGGALGAILGIFLAALVAQYAEMPTSVTLFSVLISLLVSVVTGVVFGSFPAWKAASLSPMEALRRE